MAGGGSVDTNVEEPSVGCATGDGLRMRRPLTMISPNNDAGIVSSSKSKRGASSKKKKRNSRVKVTDNASNKADPAPFCTPPPSRTQTLLATNAVQTPSNNNITRKASSFANKTPKSKQSKSTTGPTNNNSSSNPSFFSPPRVLREPLPFLSPVTPSYKDYPGTENVRLLRRPLLTLRYAWEGVYGCALRNLRWPLGRHGTRALGVGMVVVGAVMGNAMGGGFGPDVKGSVEGWIEAVLEAAFWFGCGVLSTAGLGSGVQTGALVLFPHVCTLALAWADNASNHSDGIEAGGELIEPQETFRDLMWAVAMPGFWSGTGSAVGELLPYVLARFIRAAGGDPFALLDESSSAELEDEFDANADESSATKSKKKSWTGVLLANTRSAMEGQMLESYAFVKIFILAAVPNGLFDLCGLVCGSTGVPFWTFFGAVWSGKALVRTPLQTCGLAAAVVMLSSNADEGDSESPKEEESSIRAALFRLGRDSIHKLIRGVDSDEAFGLGGDETDPSSLLVMAIKTIWTCVTIWILGFFFLSTVEQIAQHHAKTLHSGKARRRRAHG